MNANDMLFGVLPYVVVVLAVVVTVVRWRRHPFSVSSLSSQMLESRKLYWGSVPFHWGIVLILLGHIAALLVPRGFELWNGEPARLYLLEATGLTLALWAGFGLAVLAYRRLSTPRIRRVISHKETVQTDGRGRPVVDLEPVVELTGRIGNDRRIGGHQLIDDKAGPVDNPD